MRLSTYQREMQRLYRFLVPAHSRVLELGCGEGALLAGLHPAYGLGLDRDADRVTAAQHASTDRPELSFRVGDVEKQDWSGEEPFDVIVASDLCAQLTDVQATLERLHPLCKPATRLILNFHSNVWRPAMTLATFLGLRPRVKDYNWLSMGDMRNLLYLAGFEEVCGGGRVLLPLTIPLLAPLLNRVVAKLPFFRLFCLSWYIVARPAPRAAAPPAPSVSVLVPTRNERGNIEGVFQRTPKMGCWTELVFVDGHSTDGTVEEIRRCMAVYGQTWDRVQLIAQTGKGKGQAVRQGFGECRGDILTILDSDLTMPPEELPKYYEALAAGRAELANGCRLVYAQENRAMRFLNMLGNFFFAQAFSWLLGQRIKDTLCGTKTLWRADYLRIARNRDYFGDFDPFGDFDLLFGAAKLNLKIVDVPVRYRARTYGEVKINRWRDGLLLLRMSSIAFRRFKLS
jgi:SAM-dependent methyltransferase